jgi:hypothetical protein
MRDTVCGDLEKVRGSLRWLAVQERWLSAAHSAAAAVVEQD